MSSCPAFTDGIHRGLKCQCGSEMRIPPICVSIEVSNKSLLLVNEHFNCDDLWVAANALRRAADELERASAAPARTPAGE